MTRRKKTANIKHRLAALLLIAIAIAASYACLRPLRHDAQTGDTIPPPKFYPGAAQKGGDLFDNQKIEYPFTFIVYGDSREPSGDIKSAIIRRIIKENPSFVIHLGDMVTYGEAHQWEIFDLFEGKIMAAGIAFYPVLGNHEYYTSAGVYPPEPGKQLSHYFSRFAFLEGRRWYSFRYGNSSFLVLDTNTDYSAGSLQHKWFMERLRQEPSEFLFIALHHPPYTKNEDKSLRKAERFLAGILEGCREDNLPKADIVFSGHTHNYERYRYKGINYVVSGGGGAPQYMVRRDADDFYSEKGKTFHYCKVTVLKTEAIFEMFKLIGSDVWTIADSFVILGLDEK